MTTALPGCLLTSDARDLPYPVALASELRGAPDDGDSKRRHWARLLRVLFRNTPDYDPATLGALRERLGRPGGLTHPETADLVHRLVPVRRCRACGRGVLAATRDAAFCCEAHAASAAYARRVSA